MSTIPTSSRYERRRQETADRIVSAAAALFGERGVEKTTIAHLCEEADVARQTFFNHFGSKQDLVNELTRRGRDYFVEFVEAALRHPGSTGDRIALLFAQIHDATAAVGPMHQDLLSATIGANYASDEEGPRQRIGQRIVEKLIRRGRSQGDVSRRHTVEDQASLVLGALYELTTAWAHRADFAILERSARMARLLADALSPSNAEKRNA